MLIRLLLDQISSNWDWIKFSLLETTPNLTARGTTVILENLLSDAMQCWFEVTGDEKEPKLYAIIITSVFRDNFFQANCLRICSLYGYAELSQQQWQEGFDSLRAYAIGVGCSRIEAFTDRAGLGEIAKKFGGTMDYHITMEV